jgi:hypothetical protein
MADAMPDIKAMCSDLGIPFRSQLSQLEERSSSTIESEKQKQAEKQQQAQEQAKQAAQSQEQRNETSNDPDKRTPQKRERTRDAKDKDITEGE